MKVGDEVILDSPYNYLAIGQPGCSLHVENGAKGEVVTVPMGSESVRVQFAEFGDRVTVAVPIHWLGQRPRSRGNDA